MENWLSELHDPNSNHLLQSAAVWRSIEYCRKNPKDAGRALGEAINKKVMSKLVDLAAEGGDLCQLYLKLAGYGACIDTIRTGVVIDDDLCEKVISVSIGLLRINDHQITRETMRLLISLSIGSTNRCRVSEFLTLQPAAVSVITNLIKNSKCKKQSLTLLSIFLTSPKSYRLVHPCVHQLNDLLLRIPSSQEHDTLISRLRREVAVVQIHVSNNSSQ